MDEIKTKIANWLEKQGYPFEMFVAQQFKKIGFSVNQSVFYLDEESGKSREIDVIAYITKKVNDVYFNFTFVIECKVSKDKPWIIFAGDNTIQNYEFIYERYMTNNWRLLFDNLNNVNEKRSFNALKMFFINDKEIGYSVTQAFTEGQDVTFAALNGVTKASMHFMKKTNETRRKMCNIYIPIIAVDGLIFSTSITQGGEVKIKQTKQFKLIWRRSYDTHPIVIVEIFSKEVILKQAKALKKFCDDFFELASQEMEEVSLKRPYNAPNII